MAPRRPVLIFDFGNVVAFFDYNLIGEILGRSLGLSGEQFMERARSAGFNSLLRRYESGKMPAEEFGRAVCGLVGLDLTHDEFASAFSDIFRLNEPVADLVGELKGLGYTLVLGSNTNDLHTAQFRRQFAQALAPFDKMVLSHEVGHVKPSGEFYLACASAVGAAPGDCIFIDDLIENVEGARAAGLDGFVYRDVSTLRNDLRQAGVDLD